MRRTPIAAAAVLLAASTLALAPAASADTVTGPSGKIRVTAAGTSVGSLFGDLSVYPGANGSREVTMVNASTDTAILTVRAAVPASIDSALAQGLTLCWSGGDRTFGQLAGNNTVIGTALLAPGESAKASFGYRFSENAQQPAAGASTGFGLNFNLRQAAPGEKPGAVETGGDGCGPASDWNQQPVSTPSPDPEPDTDKPEKPAPGDTNPNTPSPKPTEKPAPGDTKPDGSTPGSPDTTPTAPGVEPSNPEGPAGGQPVEPTTPHDPEIVLPGDPSPSPSSEPEPGGQEVSGEPGDDTAPGSGGEKPGDPTHGPDSRPGNDTAPVADKNDAHDELVVAGADTVIASILGAGLIGAGAWLINRKRKTAK